MGTIVYAIRISIFSVILSASLSNCGIHHGFKKNITSTHKEAVYNNNNVNSGVLDNAGKKEKLAEHNPNHHIHVEDQEAERKRKPEVDGLTIFLSLIFTSTLLCLLIVVFTRCYQSYFQKPEVNHHNQVHFHRIPTGFAVMPGHIIWQSYCDTLTTPTPTHNIVTLSAPKDITPTTTFKVTHQSVVTQFHPETPPPPYRETTEEII